MKTFRLIKCSYCRSQIDIDASKQVLPGGWQNDERGYRCARCVRTKQARLRHERTRPMR